MNGEKMHRQGEGPDRRSFDEIMRDNGNEDLEEPEVQALLDEQDNPPFAEAPRRRPSMLESVLTPELQLEKERYERAQERREMQEQIVGMKKTMRLLWQQIEDMESRLSRRQ